MYRKLHLCAASLLFAVLMALNLQVHAQAASASYNPDGDADIITTYSCTPAGQSLPSEQLNWDGYDLNYNSWTIHSLGCGNVDGNFLVRFAGINAIPSTAAITYAELRLYGVPSSGFVPQGNSQYSGSPFGPNPGYVQRVTSGWNETTVTWNTAPSTTASNQTATLNLLTGTASTTMQWNEDFHIDVTALTQDIQSSGSNNGYMLFLQSGPNSPYQSAVFADRNSNTPPVLYVEYHLCNANFTYCSNTQTPNTYDFTATDPGYPNATYSWTFGDGSTGTGTSISHNYGPGSYTVCLTIIGQNGQTLCSECAQICVSSNSAPKHNTSNNNDNGSKANTSEQNVLHGTNLSLSDGTINIISVSPNPAHTRLDVNLRLFQGANVHYKIYNMTGQVVVNESKPMNAGAQKLTIPVESLTTGMYILEMADGYSIAKYKFTKE